MATSTKVLALIEAAKKAHAATLAANAEKLAAKQASQATTTTLTQTTAPVVNILSTLAAQNAQVGQAQYGIELNERQAEALERALRGQSFVLIGAAGTGKTTATQTIIRLLPQANHTRTIDFNTKHLNKDAPAIVVTGYTNKSVNHIKKKVNEKMQSHCLTLHKLIEFSPEYFEVVDENGNTYTTMRFTPSRHQDNPLPHLSTAIFEESSMIGIDLYGDYIAALPQPEATQSIFLGDIFQLPPVFGPSILGFKLSELPVVELTTVYRQALLSPIISLATAIRTNTFTKWLVEQTGKDKLTEVVTVDSAEHGKVTIHPWKKRIATAPATKTVTNLVCSMIEAGKYDPEQDQILCPFNKAFGTIELNKQIADFLTKRRGETTYEIIARYNRTYWAVGDRVLVDRHDGIITGITPTIGYQGKPPLTPSKTLNRYGYDSVLDLGRDKQVSAQAVLNELDMIAESDDDSSKKASHTIRVYIPDLEKEVELSTSAEINNLLLSYALTVHKSQGSEWRRVFIFLHHSHQTMCSRELLYTAITRAAKELYIICEGDIAPYKNQLLTGSNRAIIPGVTLAEKIEYFKSKRASMQSIE
jgi:exodeoxyribonuclease V alpha subunit